MDGCKGCASGETSKLPFTECYTSVSLTESQFKQATWEWVQDTAAATSTWGDIGDWDVSGVKDFSLAFSKHRDAGGSYVTNGNSKASTFVGTAISKWTTTALTSLVNTFRDAGAMNSNLGGWSVVKVTTMNAVFYGASKFTGGGLNLWKTTALTDLNSAFDSTGEMNSDLGGWNVAKVTSMVYTFKRASKFIGTGLGSWDTAAVTTLSETFYANGWSSEMIADLSGWDVAKVTTLYQTFKGASKFAGNDLGLWNTASVTSLYGTFSEAVEMNSDLSKWSVAKVTTLYQTFKGASKFAGTDLGLWNTASVTSLVETFKEASKFAGTGLASWNTASVTSLNSAFTLAPEMNSDLSKWSVAKVTTLWNTFYGASKFAGKDLGSWDTTAVTSLYYTFKNAGEMNADLSGWTVANVKTLEFTFSDASKFTGVGLASWDVGAVTKFGDTFTGSTALDSCEKRKIADADAWKNNAAFAANTGYIAAWAADLCPPLTNVQFKRASWGTFDSGRMIELKVPNE